MLKIESIMFVKYWFDYIVLNWLGDYEYDQQRWDKLVDDVFVCILVLKIVKIWINFNIIFVPICI